MENNDCFNCLHWHVSDHDWPCAKCKNTSLPNSEEYNSRKCFWEPNEAEDVDMVNNPPHYTHGKYECIDVMLDNFGKEAVEHFCLLNAFKYVWRSNYKNGIQDIKKAMWYLDKYLELEGVER